MRNQIVNRLIMLSVFGALTAFSAHAQAGRQFTVTIPFKFHVAGETLPAGQYIVGRSTQASADGLVLRARDGRGGVFVLTSGIQAKERSEHSKLIFNRYEDQYFLAEVWTSGVSTGRRLPGTRRERLIKQEIAKRSNSEKVTVLDDKR